ncbi:MAG TPA: bifunctional phosphoribosylaminoimidazolecarboxamide formyltransferase/IMP cyclohydrolase [Ktedonobacteraceae bacterium]|jgi:phosphoribosylaminoimidazolecarboxamide formyltransferase/IMP cyclohydrolase
MQAIVSVANREGLVELAQQLQALQVNIFSTGGTARYLQDAQINVQPVSTLTGFPEILDGRVKTLHPAIFGGILARRESRQHLDQLHKHGLAPLDIVVNNLYPFVETVAQSGTTLDEALEQIDIGGVSLIRAAAKNFKDVIVLVQPGDYQPVMNEWRETGEVSLATRLRLATGAFQYIAAYDVAIADYLCQQAEGSQRFPQELTVSLERIQQLRYGENPHQQAALYRIRQSMPTHPTVAGAAILHGKELSFNNLLDLDAALSAANGLSAPTVVIIKHTNPCGLACADTLLEAYQKAHAGDPISAYGGIIGCNRSVDQATARQISQLFYEAIIAPDYAPDALAILRSKKNLRILATHSSPPTSAGLATENALDVRSISGGMLLQTLDSSTTHNPVYTVVSERQPEQDEITDLLFAWQVVRHVKSNAIVLARKLAVLGVGAGQMNRVASVQLAVEKAAERARGSVLASDAYFPFPDGVEVAARAGVSAIIQPGGSIRDGEAIRMANRHALAMLFTGRRHFRH